MANAETLGVQGIINAHEADSTEVQQSLLLPDRPADVDVALRTTEIYLPESPITINGQSYSVVVNSDRLANAVNVVGEKDGFWGLKYPKAVVINLSEKDDEIISDGSTGFVLGSADFAPNIEVEKKLYGTVAKLTIPREVSSKELSEGGVVSFMTRRANLDLLRLLNKNLEAKRRNRGFRNLGFIGLSGSVGQGVGIALSDTNFDRVLNGSIGAGASVLATSVLLTAGVIYREHKGGNEDKTGLEKYALAKTDLASDKKIVKNRYFRKFLDDDPIIYFEPEQPKT